MLLYRNKFGRTLPRRLGLFREKQLKLQTQLPVGAVFRFFHVVKRLHLCVDRLFSDLEDFPDTAAKRHGPLIATFRLPVGGDNRRAGEIQTAGQIVVDEILRGEKVDVVLAAAGKRPDIVEQSTDNPLSRHHQSDDRRAARPLVLSQRIIRCRWKIGAVPCANG